MQLGYYSLKSKDSTEVSLFLYQFCVKINDFTLRDIIQIW